MVRILEKHICWKITAYTSEIGETVGTLPSDATITKKYDTKVL